MQSVKDKIKQFQTQLNVKPDGYFGTQSLKAFNESGKQLYLNLGFVNKLPVSYQNGYKDENIISIMASLNLNTEIRNPIYVAYILATIYHETAGTFLPLKEYGKGAKYSYGKVFDKGLEQVCYTNGKRNVTYNIREYPHLYYGRGYVQLTWFDNYKRFSDITGHDILNNPDDACRPDIATKIMIEGMLKGLFTGYSLKRAFKFGLSFDEWVDARRIINGTDKSIKIAKEALIFLQYLEIR